jgi:hypothetical protein
MKLIEAFSDEDYDKYFGENFDPLRQNGGTENADGWPLPRNIDDTSSACWAFFCEDYLPQYYSLSSVECDEIAQIIANAMWAGYQLGWNNH